MWVLNGLVYRGKERKKSLPGLRLLLCLLWLQPNAAGSLGGDLLFNYRSVTSAAQGTDSSMGRTVPHGSSSSLELCWVTSIRIKLTHKRKHAGREASGEV